MFTKLIDRYCQLIRVVMVISLALMVVLVLGNVFLRYAFNSGITVSEELSRWLFVWVTFLGTIVAMKEGAHLGTDTLISRLPLAGQKVCFLLAHVAMLFACWLLFQGSWDQVLINVDTTSPVMEISMAWFFACGLVLSVSGAVILLSQVWRFMTGQLADSELIGIRESEEEPVDAPAPLK
jgi:TRAP-type C4-dicarboxylate transport system permease small subunit